MSKMTDSVGTDLAKDSKFKAMVKKFLNSSGSQADKQYDSMFDYASAFDGRLGDDVDMTEEAIDKAIEILSPSSESLLRILNGESVRDVVLEKITVAYFIPRELRDPAITDRASVSGNIFTFTLPDKIVQKFLGHSKSMGDVYTHMSNKDVKEAVGKTIYKFEDIPEEKKHELELKIEAQDKKLKEMAIKIDGLLSGSGGAGDLSKGASDLLGGN